MYVVTVAYSWDKTATWQYVTSTRFSERKPIGKLLMFFAVWREDGILTFTAKGLLSQAAVIGGHGSSVSNN